MPKEEEEEIYTQNGIGNGGKHRGIVAYGDFLDT